MSIIVIKGEFIIVKQGFVSYSLPSALGTDFLNHKYMHYSLPEEK